MSTAMAWHRAYFFVVMWFTLWVGWFGFFRPTEILRALPWPVPPLHARFIGAIYLSATVFLLLSLLARRRAQVRAIVQIALVWTGWLLMITLLHWSSFDFQRVQVWYWLVAYIAFPVAAAMLLRLRGDDDATPPRRIDGWPVAWLWAQGIVFVALGLWLFALPATVAQWWPWKISPFLAQVYSGPVLGYGVGSLMLARQRDWAALVIPTIGLLVASALALLGSTWHLGLFAAGSPSMVLWFGTLAALATVSALLLVMAAAQRQHPRPTT